MRLARPFVFEGIEDPERRVVNAEAVPDSRARLLLDDPLPGLDEGLDLRLLARFRLDQREDPKGECHVVPPVASWCWPPSILRSPRPCEPRRRPGPLTSPGQARQR